MRNATRVAMLLAIAAATSAVAHANVQQPATELIDQCRGFMADAGSEPGKICEAYVSGFVAGATKAGVLMPVMAGSQDAFLERALRTRLGQGSRYPRAVYCVSTDTQIREVVAQLLAHADTRTDLQTAGAARVLGAALREKYPC